MGDLNPGLGSISGPSEGQYGGGGLKCAFVHAAKEQAFDSNVDEREWPPADKGATLAIGIETSMKFHPVRTLFAVILLGLTEAASPAQVMYSLPGPWVDDAANPFHLESLAGSYTVVSVAYGACQHVCSTTVRRIEQLHELARLRHVSMNFVIFGLDPAEDKPSDWAAFRASRHLSFANLQFLSGAPAAGRRMANWLGIRVWRYGEHTMHDFRIVLVSPTGTVIRSLNHFDDDVALLLP